MTTNLLPAALLGELRRGDVLHFVTTFAGDHETMRRAVEAQGGDRLAARAAGGALHLLANAAPPSLRDARVSWEDGVRLAGLMVRGGAAASSGWAALLGR
jgi:hypothetical protein